MENIYMDALDRIIGLPCSELRIGYAGTLIAGFGRLVEHKHPKLKGKFHGEWRIHNRFSRWRLISKEKIVVGDFDNESEIKEQFDKLLGMTLESVSSGSMWSDLLLCFNNGHRIEIFCADKEHESWELVGPESTYVSRRDGIFGVKSSDRVPGLPPEENMLSVHAGECHKRWILVTPQSGQSECVSCIYYEGLESGFYFSDYGVCTNAVSDFDGRIVNCKSCCTSFAETHDLTQ